MEKIILNETPVRTSRNFGINNIKLENLEIPSDIKEFKNINITNSSSKIQIEKIIKDKKNKEKLCYGMSDEFISMIDENMNVGFDINISSLTNQEVIFGFNFDDYNKNLLEKININAKENTKATIILKYSSCGVENGFHNGIIKTRLGKNSNLNIVFVNFMNLASYNFISMDNEIEDGANLNYTIIDFGAKKSLTNYYSNLIGKASNNTLNTAYIGKKEQLLDLNYIAHLRGEMSNIDMDVQGAIKDNCIKHFKGTIDFKKGAKKATGNEMEACMLLSKEARALSLPMLLCSEEDVKGNHSSSAGKVGKKELFYIMSRGFDKKQALKLIVRAKFNKIIENIKNEKIKEEIIAKIDEILN